MSIELPKTYEPAAVEADAYRVWLEEKCFHADPNDPGEPYCIVIPPPNVTGALHLGHAINNTLQDILTRKARMEGKNALWMPGIDHAGIATQAVVEKQLKESENKTRHEVGREGLVERIWKWKEQYGNRIIEQLKRLGSSCDWDRTRFTLDDMCARAVRETFFKLFKDGLVYRGKRLVNWDVHLQTSISDDEIYHETVKTHLWHIKYPIVDGPVSGKVGEPIVAEEGKMEDGEDLQTFSSDPLSRVDLTTDAASTTGVSPVHSDKNHGRDARGTGRPTFMVVATTRPETMLGDTAVAVHSEDPRWNWAIGKFVELPLTGRKIPIIADDILVDPKFGSGVVKVTPAHDPNDYAVWQRHQGKADEIDIINILNPDGTLNESAGKYKGLTINKARHAVEHDLKDHGYLIKEEPYETQIGHSDRSKTPIQPYLSDQWFVKMAPLAEPALEVVRDGTIQFFPERHAQQYLSWLGEKRDWPISRQLWWGHRIPVWRRSQRLEQLPAPLELTKIKSKLDQWQDEGRLAYHLLSDSEGISSLEAKDTSLALLYICLRSEESTTPEMTEFLEKLGMEQDPDVLDTWFSSALWPHSTLGWPDKTPDLAKWYPTSVLLTGRDIITLWVARMVMMGMYNMGASRTTSVPPVPPAGGAVTTDHALANVENFDPRQREPEQTLPVHEYASRKEHGRDARGTGSAKELGIPFHHVAINPTILDGKGERMSKTKGNGVDPVDIIDTHGADALRFTLGTMATETQDARMPVQVICPHCGNRFNNPDSKEPVGPCPKCQKSLTRPLGTAKGSAEAPLARLTSEKFDLGRNFCNKLWNASRFVLSNIESTTENTEGTEKKKNPTSSSVNSAVQSLPDRWIVTRFNATIEESNKAIAHYRFDQYAKACYDFFWRDFCDWYVEAVKPTLKTDAGKASLDTIVRILDGALRLMHPIIPFITETIWWKLNDVVPNRAGVGKIHKRLIKSEWPKAGEIDAEAEQQFSHLQEIIVAIRNVRNEHKVDPRKPVNVTIKSDAKWLGDSKQLIETLAVCKVDESIDPNAIRVSAGKTEIFVKGLKDPETEKNRNAKEREDLQKKIATLKGRMANESYMAKAPAALVQQTKDQLAAAEEELRKLGG